MFRPHSTKNVVSPPPAGEDKPLSLNKTHMLIIIMGVDEPLFLIPLGRISIEHQMPQMRPERLSLSLRLRRIS